MAFWILIKQHFYVSQYQALHFDCAWHLVMPCVLLYKCITLIVKLNLSLMSEQLFNCHMSAIIKYMLSHYMINYKTYACWLIGVWLGLEVKAVFACCNSDVAKTDLDFQVSILPFVLTDFVMEAVLSDFFKTPTLTRTC